MTSTTRGTGQSGADKPEDYGPLPYSKMPSFREAIDLTRVILGQWCASLGSSEELYASLIDLRNDLSARYTQVNQYHNADHMLNFTAYLLAIADMAGLMSNDADLVRLVVSAGYHDLGNGRTPQLQGKDEVAAVKLFLNDLHASSPQTLLGSIGIADTIRIAANIGGTVFADRLCTAEELRKQSYVSDITHLLRDHLRSKDEREIQTALGDIASAIQLKTAEPLTLSNLQDLVARLMVDREAMAMKHADLSASLTPEHAFKNYVLNRFEDREKPGIKGTVDPQAYVDGFINFQQGMFHLIVHPNDLGPNNHHFMRAMQSRFNDAYNSVSSLFIEDRLTKAITMLQAEVTPFLTNKYMSFGQTSEHASANAEKLTAALGGNLRLFTEECGWHPTVFMGTAAPGQIDHVAIFGDRKLAQTKNFVNSLVRNHHDLMTGFHVLVNQGIDLSEITLYELISQLKLVEIPARGHQDQPMRIDMDRYERLRQVAADSPPGCLTLGAIEGQELNKLFFPDENLKVGGSHTPRADELFGSP